MFNALNKLNESTLLVLKIQWWQLGLLVIVSLTCPNYGWLTTVLPESTVLLGPMCSAGQSFETSTTLDGSLTVSPRAAQQSTKPASTNVDRLLEHRTDREPVNRG